jgi:hypothetical protein
MVRVSPALDQHARRARGYRVALITLPLREIFWRETFPPRETARATDRVETGTGEIVSIDRRD